MRLIRGRGTVFLASFGESSKLPLYWSCRWIHVGSQAESDDEWVILHFSVTVTQNTWTGGHEGKCLWGLQHNESKRLCQLILSDLCCFKGLCIYCHVFKISIYKSDVLEAEMSWLNLILRKYTVSVICYVSFAVGAHFCMSEPSKPWITYVFMEGIEMCNALLSPWTVVNTKVLAGTKNSCWEWFCRKIFFQRINFWLKFKVEKTN